MRCSSGTFQVGASTGLTSRTLVRRGSREPVRSAVEERLDRRESPEDDRDAQKHPRHPRAQHGTDGGVASAGRTLEPRAASRDARGFGIPRRGSPGIPTRRSASTRARTAPAPRSTPARRRCRPARGRRSCSRRTGRWRTSRRRRGRPATRREARASRSSSPPATPARSARRTAAGGPPSCRGCAPESRSPPPSVRIGVPIAPNATGAVFAMSDRPAA